MALIGSIQNESVVSFQTSFDKSKVMKNITKEIKPKVDKIIQEHIKSSIKRGIIKTQSQIISIPTREGVIAPQIIAGSLNAYQLPHVNQHIRYKVGSYGRNDSPQKPTGARGSRMNKTDKSLTTLYEEGSGPFKMEGTIGAGSTKNRGHVGKGRRQGEQFKRIQEATNKIVVSEKGYGRGIAYSGSSSNRGVPMITNPGYERLGAMRKLHQNILKNIRDTSEMESQLEAIRTNANKKENTSVLENRMQVIKSPVVTTTQALKRR
tara:strand:+ start:118 stop:909 length:792 start_codon:yes stop_codon:yes gene_type:complete